MRSVWKLPLRRFPANPLVFTEENTFVPRLRRHEPCEDQGSATTLEAHSRRLFILHSSASAFMGGGPRNTRRPRRARLEIYSRYSPREYYPERVDPFYARKHLHQPPYQLVGSDFCASIGRKSSAPATRALTRRGCAYLPRAVAPDGRKRLGRGL
jgi:hypothetical protein